jgi:hypothetical protein
MAMRSYLVIVIVAMAAGGCAGSVSRGGLESCTSGHEQSCFCPDGRPGTQSCVSHGSWGPCDCTTAPMPDAGLGPVRCGDRICATLGGENCLTCPDDCGACPPCNYAPTCTDSAGVPINPTLEPNLNDPGGGPWMGMYGKDGPINCGPPKLRMRVSKIHANDGNGDQMYCIVQASDGVQSGVAITNKTSGLGGGDDYFFDPSVGVFWGQMALAESRNNLTITYNCLEVKNDVWAAVLKAAGMAAGQAGSFAGPYGWAFGLGDIGLQAAAAALGASNGDENVFNAQQIIDKNELLDLTNGKIWQIERQGGSCGGFIGIGTHSCDWTLTIESWGCADAVPTPG